MPYLPPLIGVYPRVCGGTHTTLVFDKRLRGLSPRVRGNPRAYRLQLLALRSIPACAGEPSCLLPHFSSAAVYPRVCGGTPGVDRRAGAAAGLSPRVRGNHTRQGERDTRRGSIPACAGEPRRGMGGRRLCAVYPRVCGGTGSRRRTMEPIGGLSPRVRGNPDDAAEWFWSQRSIPACAGEPHRPPACQSLAGVYPRVCGGTGSRRRTMEPIGGLSPRVRGNPDDAAEWFWSQRSIPACAGEPHRPPACQSLAGVYPRVCGGTRLSLVHWHVRRGLSPRVRGNPSPTSPSMSYSRSIPACAGEPRCGLRRTLSSRVYPRVCGGTIYLLEPPIKIIGLSPRVRGNLRRAVNRFAHHRSIPACAGEPAASLAAAGVVKVYPRVCGGTGRLGLATRNDRGLSPRVRGNQYTTSIPQPQTGSIPACAGEPNT